MSARVTLILAILMLSAIVGALDAYCALNGIDLRVSTAASVFPFAILLFMWCKADASFRQVSPPPGATLLVGMLALVGIPYYFFRTMPALRAAIYSSCAICILAFSMFITSVCYWFLVRLYAI